MNKKIYLFCSAGMSTSMLAKKMQAVADEHKVPADIKAFSHSKIKEVVDTEHPDCILLGPQVKYLLEETKNEFGKDAPVAVIDMADYGAMNGEAVLKKAIALVKNFNK